MLAALIYTLITFLVIAFHVALLFGVAWGDFALAGKFPGRLPHRARIIVVFEIAVLVAMSMIVLIRSGLLPSEFHEISKTAIWGVVAITSISMVLNMITPSKPERMLWGPITVMQLICCSVVAMT